MFKYPLSFIETSMKRALMFIIIVMIVFISACQKQVKEETQKPSETQTPPAETTGDAATDSFGNDMGNVNNEDKELSSSELEGIDSGFSDVENI